MRLVVASLLVGCLVGCSTVDPYQTKAYQERARIMKEIEADMPEAMRRAEAREKARQAELKAIEYAEQWHNDQLRKQGYVVCEQRSAKVLACK